MEQILKELERRENIRTNLSNLRQQIKDAEKKLKLQQNMEQQGTLFIEFLKSEEYNTTQALELIEAEFKGNKYVDNLVNFVKSSKEAVI